MANTPMIGALFAALAGLCSGTWPLFMRQTGLGGHLMPLAFCVGAGAVAVLFALGWMWHFNVSAPQAVRWSMLFPAGLFGGGVLVFVASMLAVSDANSVGINLLVLALMQITVPALYTIYMTGGMPSFRVLCGFAASYAAVMLLVGGSK